MPWWIASVIANAAIIATEHLNRHADGSWLSVLPQTLPLIIIAQWCLFYSFNSAPHWLIAWMVFSVGNSIMRVAAVSLFSTDAVGSWPLVCLAVGIMLSASLVLKTGLR